MDPEARLEQIGRELPAPMEPAGTYRPATEHGDVLHIAGQGPVEDGEIVHTGRLGDDLTVKDGQAAARLTALNVLAVARAHLGSLSPIAQVAKATVYVAATPGFGDHAAVADGATDVFDQVFGQPGRPARAAVGVSSLPFGIPVEVETTFQLDPERL